MSYHIHFLSESGTLARFKEDHQLCRSYHESVVKEGNIKSVSHLFLPSIFDLTLYFPCSAPIYGFEANDPRIGEMYSRFGPTPRICFDYLKQPARLNAHRASFEEAISELSSRRLLQIVHGARTCQMDDTSHTILLVRRRGRLSERLTIVEPITAAVDMAIRNQLKRETQTERLFLYRSLANIEDCRRLAGILYELLAQEKLQQDDRIRLNPMVHPA